MVWVILLILIGVFVVLPIKIYNTLVAGKNGYLNAFAQIQVQLQRRHDLVPNLVETAKAYLTHENETLRAVTEARAAAQKSLDAAGINPNSMALANLSQHEMALTGALRSLNVVMEAYPELKADLAVANLTEALESTENRVGFARQAYNDAVMNYNISRQSFPASLLADFFGHKKDAVPLRMEDETVIQSAPRVSIS